MLLSLWLLISVSSLLQMAPVSDEVYVGQIYVSPQAYTSKVSTLRLLLAISWLDWMFTLCVTSLQLKVRALYDYQAQKRDELSFVKNSIITNVQRQDGGW